MGAVFSRLVRTGEDLIYSLYKAIHVEQPLVYGAIQLGTGEHTETNVEEKETKMNEFRPSHTSSLAMESPVKSKKVCDESDYFSPSENLDDSKTSDEAFYCDCYESLPPTPVHNISYGKNSPRLKICSEKGSAKLSFGCKDFDLKFVGEESEAKEKLDRFVSRNEKLGQFVSPDIFSFELNLNSDLHGRLRKKSGGKQVIDDVLLPDIVLFELEGKNSKQEKSLQEKITECDMKMTSGRFTDATRGVSEATRSTHSVSELTGSISSPSPTSKARLSQGSHQSADSMESRDWPCACCNPDLLDFPSYNDLNNYEKYRTRRIQSDSLHSANIMRVLSPLLEVSETSTPERSTVVKQSTSSTCSSNPASDCSEEMRKLSCEDTKSVCLCARTCERSRRCQRKEINTPPSKSKVRLDGEDIDATPRPNHGERVGGTGQMNSTTVDEASSVDDASTTVVEVNTENEGLTNQELFSGASTAQLSQSPHKSVRRKVTFSDASNDEVFPPPVSLPTHKPPAFSRQISTESSSSTSSGDSILAFALGPESPLSPDSEAAFEFSSGLHGNCFGVPRGGTDLVLVAEGVKFHVHRSLVLGACPMLRAHLRETSACNVVLHGKRAADVLDFLRLLYPGKSQAISDRNLEGILDLAFQFGADSAQQTCIAYLEGLAQFKNLCSHQPSLSSNRGFDDELASSPIDQKNRLPKEEQHRSGSNVTYDICACAESLADRVITFLLLASRHGLEDVYQLYVDVASGVPTDELKACPRYRHLPSAIRQDIVEARVARLEYIVSSISLRKSDLVCCGKTRHDNHRFFFRGEVCLRCSSRRMMKDFKHAV